MKLQSCPVALFFVVALALASFSSAIPHPASRKLRRDSRVERIDASPRPDKLAMRNLVATDDAPALEKDTIPPSPTPDACWQRDKHSISYRSGDCMPYHWTSYTQRTHTHHIADNEVVTGKCGLIASSKIQKDRDLGWDINYDKNAKKVTVTLKNYGGRFCFGDNDFGVGCVVDRYVC